MKKTIILSVSFILSALAGLAQNYQWTNSQSSEVTSMCVLSNSDLIIVSREVNGCQLRRINALGQIVWTKNFCTQETYVNIVCDSNDSLYMVGIINETSGTCDLDPGNGTINYTIPSKTLFIQQLDTDANTVWYKTYPNFYFNAAFSSVPNIAVNNFNGTIALVGAFIGTLDLDPSTSVGLLNNPEFFTDRFVGLFNSNGTCLASYSEDTGGNSAFTCCKFDDNNNLIAGGYKYSNGDCITIESFDSALNRLWFHSGTVTSVAGNVYDLDITDDNEIIYCGKEINNTVVYKIPNPETQVIQNTSVIWKKTYDGIGYRIQSIAQGTNDTIYLGGLVYGGSNTDISPDGMINDTLGTYNTQRGLLTVLDGAGNFQSVKWFNHDNGPSSNPPFSEINCVEVNGNGLYASGTKKGSIDFDSDLIGEQNDGFNNNSGFLNKWELYSSSAAVIDLDNVHLQIYPNPASTKMMLSVDRAEAITIRDLNGKMVQEIVNYTGGTIHLIKMKAGVYFVDIAYNGERIIQKLVID